MFLIHTLADGRATAVEYLPAGAITPKVGMALYQNGGNLAVASGTTKPTYICMAERETALTAGEVIPVTRILPDVVYETTLSAAGTSLKLGDKVTIATGGEQVTATTTDGVAEIVEIVDTAVGGKVRVRFA